MEQLWIGMVEIKPKEAGKPPEGFEGMAGAYVNGITPASSAAEAQEIFTTALSGWGFAVVQFEEMEPLSLRLKRVTLSPELQEAHQEVIRTGETRFGSFHIWGGDDE